MNQPKKGPQEWIGLDCQHEGTPCKLRSAGDFAGVCDHRVSAAYQKAPTHKQALVLPRSAVIFKNMSNGPWAHLFVSKGSPGNKSNWGLSHLPDMSSMCCLSEFMDFTLLFLDIRL